MKELTLQMEVDVLGYLQLIKYAIVVSASVGTRWHSVWIELVVECRCCLMGRVRMKETQQVPQFMHSMGGMA